MSPMANQGKTESDGGKDGVCMSISEQKPHHGQAPGCIQVQGSSEPPQLWGRLPGLPSPGGPAMPSESLHSSWVFVVVAASDRNSTQTS